MEATEENIIEISYENGQANKNCNDASKVYLDGNKTGSPDEDAPNTITFWNIDQNDSFEKVTSYHDDSAQDTDLIDNLLQDENVVDKQFEKSIGENGRKASGENESNGTQTGLLSDKRKHTEEANNDKLDTSNDDSDIVEINVNLNSVESKGKHDTEDASVLQTESSVKPYRGQKQTDTIHDDNVLTKDGDKSDTAKSMISLDDSDIFTKSLILSGITEPSMTISGKRPYTEFLSPERQYKRAKLGHADEHFGNDKTKHQVPYPMSFDSAESSTPVAIVFPMETDHQSQVSGEYLKYMKENSLKAGFHEPNAQSNDQPPKVSKESYPTCLSNVVIKREQCEKSLTCKVDTASVTVVPKNAGSLGNFEFDFDIIDTKDDFPADITPTINHLDEYEEVLAGLFADIKQAKEQDTYSEMNNVQPNPPSLSLKEEIKCVPPNVTYSSALKCATSSFNMCNSSTFPQSIADNIEHIMASSTMKPMQGPRSYLPVHAHQSFPNDFGKRPGQFQNYRSYLERQNENFKPLQTFSLHSDSNLLRKMISTPISDSNDAHDSNSAACDNSRPTSAPAQTMNTDLSNTANNVGTGPRDSTDVKPHMTETLQPGQIKSESASVTDKPAMSEQVRARITLHHTGAKDTTFDQSKSLLTETLGQTSSSLASSLQMAGLSHSQNQLPGKAHDIFSPGMKDLLLQHSIRRRQLAISQMNQQHGHQNVPSLQYGSNVHPSAFPQGHRYPQNPQQSDLVRRQFSHMPNIQSRNQTMSDSFNLQMLDERYNGRMHSQSVLSGRPGITHGILNTQHGDSSNGLNSSTRMSQESVHQPGHQLNPHLHSVNSLSRSMNSTAYSLNPAARSVSPSAHSLNPSAHSLNPSAHSVNPSVHSVNSAAHSVNPALHALNPAAHAVNPAARSLSPSALSVNQSAHSVNRVAHSVNTSAHSLNPSAHSMNPSAHSVNPHSVNPSAHSVNPDAHSLNRARHSVSPSGHAANPSTHSVNPSAHSVSPSAHSVNLPSQSVSPPSHPNFGSAVPQYGIRGSMSSQMHPYLKHLESSNMNRTWRQGTPMLGTPMAPYYRQGAPQMGMLRQRVPLNEGQFPNMPSQQFRPGETPVYNRSLSQPNSTETHMYSRSSPETHVYNRSLSQYGSHLSQNGSHLSQNGSQLSQNGSQLNMDTQQTGARMPFVPEYRR